jgi:hypothetical protein
MEHTVHLVTGYTEKGVTHAEVTFGRRLRGRQLFNISDQEGGVEYGSRLYQAAVTRFGSLPSPIPLKAFLSLAAIDRELLEEGYNKFMQDSIGGRMSEAIDESTVKLPIGFQRGDLVYNVATFGNQLTGYDEMKAERQRVSAMEKTCFLLGMEITKFCTEDGAHSLETPIGLSVFDQMDVADLIALNQARGEWFESIRAEIASRSAHPATWNPSSLKYRAHTRSKSQTSEVN